MKQLSSVVIGIVMLIAGLVAFSSGSTQAGPYTGTIPTYCSADPANKPKAGQDAKVHFKAGTKGNGRPHGIVTFTYTKNGKAHGAFARDYEGGNRVYRLGPMPSKGTYDVLAHFDSKPKNSAYKNCSHSFTHRFQGRDKD